MNRDHQPHHHRNKNSTVEKKLPELFAKSFDPRPLRLKNETHVPLPVLKQKFPIPFTPTRDNSAGLLEELGHKELQLNARLDKINYATHLLKLEFHESENFQRQIIERQRQHLNRMFSILEKSALLIQTCFRRHVAQQYVKQLYQIKAAKIIQWTICSYIKRRLLGELNAAVVLQKYARGRICRKKKQLEKMKHAKKAACKIQSIWRGKLIRKIYGEILLEKGMLTRRRSHVKAKFCRAVTKSKTYTSFVFIESATKIQNMYRRKKSQSTSSKSNQSPFVETSSEKKLPISPRNESADMVVRQENNRNPTTGIKEDDTGSKHHEISSPVPTFPPTVSISKKKKGCTTTVGYTININPSLDLLKKRTSIDFEATVPSSQRPIASTCTSPRKHRIVGTSKKKKQQSIMAEKKFK